MRKFESRRASKKDRHLRLSLEGLSGSGKTFTALLLACHLSTRIKPGSIPTLIDSEGCSSEDYADLFEFNIVPLPPPYGPQDYMDAMDYCLEEYPDSPITIVDSFSHLWAGSGGELEMVDKFASRGGRNNKFGDGWKNVTPLHNTVVSKILEYPRSLIGTLRQKGDYVIEMKNGKQQPRKVGTKAVMRDAWEYEFTLAGTMTDEHDLMISKSRMHGIYDANDVIPKPGEEFGEALWKWMNPDGGSYEPVVEKGETPAATAEERDAKPGDFTVEERARMKERGITNAADFNAKFKGQTKAEVMAWLDDQSIAAAEVL